MEKGGGWFEKLLRGCILVTGCYIIYRGGTILAETGYLGKLMASDPVISVVQDTVLNTYLPGYPQILEELPEDGALARWLEQLIPVLKNWYKQGLERDFQQEGTEESETGQVRETDSERETKALEEAKKGAEPGTEGGIAFGEGREEKNKETEADSASEILTETEASREVLAEGAGEALFLEQLGDFDYLLNHYFVVDQDTAADETLLDAERFLSYDLKLEQNPKVPQILIYHTHSQETFLDSRPGEEEDSIIGMGAYLAELLEGYGYQVIHDTGVYDLVNGVLDRSASYDYARTAVEKILEENPTIEVIIDLHRDGVEGEHFVTDIDGKQASRIMFFNGISQNSSGQPIEYLHNPYIQENLAFSFQLQLAAEKKYPGFTRNIYLKGQRYNLHLRPRSLLVEAGTQLNTVEEERNAMVPLAQLLHEVLSGACE